VSVARRRPVHYSRAALTIQFTYAFATASERRSETASRSQEIAILFAMVAEGRALLQAMDREWPFRDRGPAQAPGVQAAASHAPTCNSLLEEHPEAFAREVVE
jgi:hypothetical protein